MHELAKMPSCCVRYGASQCAISSYTGSCVRVKCATVFAMRVVDFGDPAYPTDPPLTLGLDWDIFRLWESSQE